MKPLIERLQDVVGFIRFENDRVSAAGCLATEAIDKIEGLEADLEDAVKTAFDRGATEWCKLNYPDLYKHFNKK